MTQHTPRGTGTQTRAGAARTLEGVLARRAHADSLLDTLFEKNPHWDPRDRSFVFEMVYGVLRHLSLLDARLAPLSNRPLLSLDPLVLQALRVGAYQVLYMDRVPAHSAVYETVEALKFLGFGRAAPLVNALLRRVLGLRGQPPPAPVGGEDVVESLALAHSHPQWLVERWARQWGSGSLEALLRANNTRRPCTLRVVKNRTSVEELCQFFLDNHGIEAEARPLDGCLRLPKWPPFALCPAFQKGHYFVQDEGAQLVTALAGGAPLGFVLDACAAPGGKAGLLWDRGVDPGRLWLWDVAPARVSHMEKNLARIGLTPARVGTGDVVEGVGTQEFSLVVLDAPCTGLGVVGRHPEIRWNRTPTDVATCAAQQERLLEGLAPRVAPGGEFLYAVCSLEPEETTQQISSFLSHFEDFEALPLHSRLPSHYHRYIQNGCTLQLRPGNEDDLDGFFACIFRRRGPG